MLEGNVHVAVCWLMECSDGGVLKPSDSTTIGGTSMTVLEVLGLKHPELVLLPNGFCQLWLIYHSLRILKLLVSIFYQLHISYKEVKVLVGVMLHFGEIVC